MLVEHSMKESESVWTTVSTHTHTHTLWHKLLQNTGQHTLGAPYIQIEPDLLSQERTYRRHWYTAIYMKLTIREKLGVSLHVSMLSNQYFYYTEIKRNKTHITKTLSTSKTIVKLKLVWKPPLTSPELDMICNNTVVTWTKCHKWWTQWTVYCIYVSYELITVPESSGVL